VNGVLPVLGAGATFAASALLGLLAGVWLARSTGQGLWVLGGFVAGIGLGGYSAYRLLRRSM
jgi:hypothetical protein